MSRFHFAAWMLPLVLTMGCASTQADSGKPGHVVVGQGSSDDRSAINSNNQQIFNAEHAMSPDPSVSSGTPNTNLP
jgi:hypothetical protein